jgi:hypothetical protein
MKTSTFLSRLQAACIICLLLPGLAKAQSDTLTINGTFQAWWLEGEPGPDLYPVFASGQAHTWTLTMYGVTYEEDYSFLERSDGYFDEQYITRARSTSFTLEFFGLDGSTLNSVVSEPLTEVAVEFINGRYIYTFDVPYLLFSLQLLPADPGVEFSAVSHNETGWFTPGHPTFHPQTLPFSYETIVDHRFGGNSAIYSYSPAVYIGSPVPPPPPPAAVAIADGSTFEGNNGTKTLALTLSLSGGPLSEPVSVQYQTINGTATSTGTKKSPADYKAATGTVTFQPGQTGQTISVLVNGDRKKEANETFTVQISASSSQVEISDSTATATILNDD